MHRRHFIRSLAATAGTGVAFGALAARAEAALPQARITRVRIYEPPNPNPIFNQSNLVVTVETDADLTGVGEGGSRDTLSSAPAG